MNDGGIFPGISLRQPPSNLRAEQALLGALLHQNKCRDRCEHLKPEHFADQEYGRLFARITERIDAGRAVSAVSLKSEFSDELLANMLASMIGTIHVPECAAAIIDTATRRHLIEIGESLVAQSFAGGTAMETALDAANRIDALAIGECAPTAVMLDIALDDAMAAIDAAKERQGPSGITTGFRAFDSRIGGLEPATLTVIAGRPGMGKSSLVLQWAVTAAESGVGTLLISLEMSARELARRVLATAARVPVTAMKYGRINDEQADRIVAARRRLRSLPLKIDDSAGLTVAQIAIRARSMKRQGLGLVVVDHLHIVRPEDADIKAGATWAIGRISGAMKRIAKDCGVPVVLAAQLSRGVEARDDKRPVLSDLRQAGDIEQDADAVGFVYRPEYYIKSQPDRKAGEGDGPYESRLTVWETDKARLSGAAELIWAKIRDGEPGTDNMVFDKPTTTFREVENGL